MSDLPISLQQASLLGLVASFSGGFLFSFNPVSFASIPISIAYVTKARSFRRALILGGAFVVGTILTHVILGVAAALGGDWMNGVMGRQWGLLLGPILILLGLIWTGWFNLSIPWFSARGQRVATVWGAFLLAIPFTVGVCPACSPGLWVVLAASAGIGSAPYAALLLFLFALGRTLPVIAGTLSIGWLESLRALSRWQKPLEVSGGVTLMLVGIYLLNQSLFLFQS